MSERLAESALGHPQGRDSEYLIPTHMTNYKVIIKVQNEPGVLARISILLRKFNVNIQSIDAKPLAEEQGFTEIHINLETDNPPQGFETVMKKLGNLIPVVEVNYEKN